MDNASDTEKTNPNTFLAEIQSLLPVVREHTLTIHNWQQEQGFTHIINTDIYVFL